MAFEILEGALPAQTAAGATSVTEIGVVPSTESSPTATVAKISVASPTLVTGVVTNNATINVRKVPAAGGGAVVLGSLILAVGANLAAETEVNIPVTVGAVLDGDVIDVQLVQNGTGLALPAGILAKVELSA